ncbi:MAG: cohesin domain-containing protein, partial [Ruminococcus callidus]|nr:cohesin domain-containing protein [Ruminococcus callidus]
MKKFISALTSVCIAATSLVGATMTTATAAGELELTFKERTTSSTTFNISSADLAAGDVTVDCDMIITNYVPVYGFGLKMDFENIDTNTIYDASTEENPFFAFTSATQFDKTGPFTDVWGVEDETYEPQPGLCATKIANYAMMNFVWRTAATLDDDSTPTNAYFIPGTTTPLLNISFTVAQNTPKGTYILDIKTEPYTNTTGGATSTGQSKVNNVDGEVVPFKTVPLTIVVGDAEETTTTAAATTTKAPATTTKAPTTTTKTETPADGVVYQIATVEGEAGADIDVPITIKGDTGTAGMVLELSADSNLKLKRRLNGDAYEGAPTWNATTLTYVWNSGDGRNLVAADGSTLTTLRFTVPADAQPGDEFPITFREDLCKVIDQDGNTLGVSFTNGKIVIPDVTTTTTEEVTTTTTEAETTTTEAETTTTEAETTTTEAETTTEEVTTTTTVETTTLPDPGAVTYIVPEVTAAAGDEVTMPVQVLGDPGTAGVYAGGQWNDAKLIYAWSSGEGENVTADNEAAMFSITFKV